jgi:hypothetical protein
MNKNINMRIISKLPLVIITGLVFFSIYFNYQYLADKDLSPLHPFLSKEERTEYFFEAYQKEYEKNVRAKQKYLEERVKKSDGTDEDWYDVPENFVTDSLGNTTRIYGKDDNNK